ncbi:hypothetical protein FGO68_gene14881 [Halteria grandinella]|uniref:Cytochrome P450 n=1 Tax=Halteria grandinella TaxID=5974 RepID=A0A8J8T4T2_HALGN|nr:hypothetical protein FGO68_gene14881 [Halteria grandinella]
MRDPRGIIVVTDPTYVDELYIGKNKFFDKADKDKDTYYQWFGDSIFLSRSDQHWHQSRKHLSAAFYKDKMNLLLRTIMSVTNDRVQQWRSTFAQPSQVQDGPGHAEMSLTKEISDMLVDSMLGSVFGMRSVNHTLTLGYYGEMFDVTLGRYMKIIGGRFFSRIYHPLRQLFDMFDRWNLNADEKENWDNLERLRAFVKKMINDRKELLQGGNGQAAQGKFDFLTQLLDDSFFIGAATQTSSVLFTNVLYFLLKNPEAKEKCLNEIKTKLLPHLPPGTDLTKDTTWHQLMLSEETVDSCPYLLQCIYETLRIDSSATVSTALKVTETVEIKDKMIRSDSKILINMQRLHLNPQQWQEPHRFIPDRFNPESPYYLTPAVQR